MDSPITEDMIYLNLIKQIFNKYEGLVRDQVFRFFDKYDPRVSIDRSKLINLFESLFNHFNDLVGDFEL